MTTAASPNPWNPDRKKRSADRLCILSGENENTTKEFLVVFFVGDG